MGITKELPITTVLDRIPSTWTEEEIMGFWYDWFCKDASLVKKGQRLLARLRSILPSPRFNPETTYVFFKNNCPCDGSLYDDFRICDKATGDVIYCVVPAEGYTRTKGQACVWGKAPDGEWGELVRGSWKDVKTFFKVPESQVAQIVEATRWANLVRVAEIENAEFDREQRSKKYRAEREARDENREYCDQLSHLLGISI